MEIRVLGDGLQVTALGLGLMGMSGVYGEADDDESIATIRAALDAGVTLFDNAEAYGGGHSEEVLGRALAGRRDEAVVTTKFGLTFHNGVMGEDGTPENVRASLEASLRRMGMDHVDVYFQHRVDLDTPIEETVGAMAELVAEGKARHIGLCEVSAATLRRAHAVHPLAAVQSEYSLWHRDPEDEVLPACEELGVGFMAYSPLGRGMLTGRVRRFEDLPAGDFRRVSPRFQGENFQRNLDLVDHVTALGVGQGRGAGAAGAGLDPGPQPERGGRLRQPPPDQLTIKSRCTDDQLVDRRAGPNRGDRPQGRGRRRGLAGGVHGPARPLELPYSSPSVVSVSPRWESMASLRHTSDKAEHQSDHHCGVHAQLDLGLAEVLGVVRSTEGDLGADGQDVTDGGDDPDDQERLELQAGVVEVGHDRPEDLHHDDDEQDGVDDRSSPVRRTAPGRCRRARTPSDKDDAGHPHQHDGDDVVDDILRHLEQADDVATLRAASSSRILAWRSLWLLARSPRQRRSPGPLSAPRFPGHTAPTKGLLSQSGEGR